MYGLRSLPLGEEGTRIDDRTCSRSSDNDNRIVGERKGPNRLGLVCGFLGCDVRPFNPLLGALPKTMVVSDRNGDNTGWLGQFMHLAVAEATDKRAGGEGVLLSELMFVEAIRWHLDSMAGEQTAWLAGLRDRCVGRSLTLLHSKPAHPWTLEKFAREVGLSRSSFAERFAHFVGQPPMHYLSHWRMQLAAGLLADGAESIGKIAQDVGYTSEAAFSRTFKVRHRQPGVGNGERLEIEVLARVVGVISGIRSIFDSARCGTAFVLRRSLLAS